MSLDEYWTQHDQKVTQAPEIDPKNINAHQEVRDWQTNKKESDDTRKELVNQLEFRYTESLKILEARQQEILTQINTEVAAVQERNSQ